MRDKDGNVYNATTADFNEARNSKLIKDIRVKMLEGEWHPACVRCKQEEASGLNSRRAYENDNWSVDSDKVLASTGPDGELNTSEFPVKYYDLRFGNLCNLSCRMCGPSDSSAWYDDYVKLTGKTAFYDTSGDVELIKENKRWKTNAYDWHESEKFWKEISKNLNEIRHIYMAGGEPLLIERHYDFLEECINRDFAKNIILEYNTNLTVLPDRVISLWSMFKQVRVGASIDGIGDVLEYQRYPVKSETIEKNLVKLAQLPDNIFSWLACTVTVYNAFHLTEFIDWKLSRQDLKNINRTKKRPVITYHMAHNPRHLNVRAYPEQLKGDLVAHYDQYKEKVKKSDYSDLIKSSIYDILDAITKYMMGASYYEKNWDAFKSYTKKLDEIRGESITNIDSIISRYI